MDKIKSFSVCDMENDGFWCNFGWREGSHGGERKRARPGGPQFALSWWDRRIWGAPTNTAACRGGPAPRRAARGPEVRKLGPWAPHASSRPRESLGRPAASERRRNCELSCGRLTQGLRIDHLGRTVFPGQRNGERPLHGCGRVLGRPWAGGRTTVPEAWGPGTVRSSGAQAAPGPGTVEVKGTGLFSPLGPRPGCFRRSRLGFSHPRPPTLWQRPWEECLGQPGCRSAPFRPSLWECSGFLRVLIWCELTSNIATCSVDFPRLLVKIAVSSVV